jgi:hypothetical protein
VLSAVRRAAAATKQARYLLPHLPDVEVKAGSGADAPTPPTDASAPRG